MTTKHLLHLQTLMKQSW